MEDITKKYARYFVFTVAALVIFGALMVYSSSYMFARDQFGASHYFFVRQVIYGLTGVLAAWFLSKTKLNFWYRYSHIFNACVSVLLIATMIPGIGLGVKGARRWISMVGMTLQPGELVKLTIVFASLAFFEKFAELSVKQRVWRAVGIVLPLVLLLMQPDYGTFSICLALIVTVCFLSSFPRKYFYGLLCIAATSALGLLFMAPYRVQRLLTYLDPWKDPKNSGFQIIQSFLAFANGSFLGQGLGNSSEKLFYLPEAHNDFIFSVVGEELGFLGVSIVVATYLLMIFFGLKLAVNAKNRLSSIVITLVIFSLGFQSFLNMAVVLGLLPTKGLNLPFISYGGSSLICNLMAIGVLLSALKSDDVSVKSFANTASTPMTPPPPRPNELNNSREDGFIDFARRQNQAFPNSNTKPSMSSTLGSRRGFTSSRLPK